MVWLETVCLLGMLMDFQKELKEFIGALAISLHHILANKGDTDFLRFSEPLSDQVLIYF